jgi:hypothetical protein
VATKITGTKRWINSVFERQSNHNASHIRMGKLHRAVAGRAVGDIAAGDIAAEDIAAEDTVVVVAAAAAAVVDTAMVVAIALKAGFVTIVPTRSRATLASYADAE